MSGALAVRCMLCDIFEYEAAACRPAREAGYGTAFIDTGAQRTNF